MTDPEIRPVFEHDVDWTAARVFLRRRLAGALRSSDSSLLEDLTQDALVRLLRAIRREGANRLEGLMAEIARRTATDHVRSKIRWKLFQESLARHLGSSDAGQRLAPFELGDPVSNLRFLVLEFFRLRGSPCRHLARAYFEDQQWEKVAERLGRTHEAVRKQWSRCLAVLRDAADRDPDFLWRSAVSGEEERDA